MACLLCAATALAGTQVRSGDHKLQFTAKSSSSKSKHTTTVHLISVGGTVSGVRSKNPTVSIVLNLAGFSVKPGKTPVCKLSVLSTPKGCPAGSRVGSGSATADARPTIAKPVPATITMYYGVDDLDVNGKLTKPKPAILAHASALGVTSDYAFDVGRGGKLTLNPGPPSAASTALFELTGFDVSFGKVIQTPTSCAHAWKVSETYIYNSGSRLTASDRIACKH